MGLGHYIARLGQLIAIDDKRMPATADVEPDPRRYIGLVEIVFAKIA